MGEGPGSSLSRLALDLRASLRRKLPALPIARWKGIPAGFILSTGRTGTQRLAEVITAATGHVLSLHEPWPDLFELGEAFARGQLSVYAASSTLRRARQGICNRARRQHALAYVESNTNASYLPAVIRVVFDRPRFAHIVRDGREVVRSMYSKTNPGRRPGHPAAYFMDHDDGRCRLAAVDFPDDPWAPKWHAMSRFERICWHWAKKNALLREALGSHPDAIVLRYEDIFDKASGFSGFGTLLSFLEIDRHMTAGEHEVRSMLGARTNRCAFYDLPQPEAWPLELKAAFDRIAGEEQRRYYG